MKSLKMAMILGVSVLALTACGAKAATNAQDNMETAKTEQTQMMDDKSEDKMSGDKMKENMSDKKMMDDKKVTKSVEKMNQGDIAPDMILKDKDGKEVKLSQMTGKKVYVKFWASWCPICLSGLEELNELAGQNNDFEIVTVVAPNINGEKSKEDFIKWFEGLGHKNIKVLYDETGDSIKNYGVRAYPTSVVVGSDGVLIGVQPGHLSADMIKDAFTKVK